MAIEAAEVLYAEVPPTPTPGPVLPVFHLLHHLKLHVLVAG